MPTPLPRPKPTDASASRSILDNIRHVVRALRVSSRAAEAAVGLSGAQLFVLQCLGESGVLSLGELAERTLTHQSSASVVVHKLVDKGLVTRDRAEDDARRYELSLTSPGRALLRKAPDVAQKRLFQAVEALPPLARRNLARALTKVVATMGAGGEPAGLFFEEEPASASSSSPKKGARRERA